MWVAAGCVLGASVIWGYTMHQQARCRLYHLRQMEKLLECMLYEIKFIHRPLQEILEIYVGQSVGIYHDWACAILQEQGKSRESISICWEHQTRIFFGKTQCPKEILGQLLEIGESSSFSDSRQQENVWSYLLAKVKKNMENIKKEEEEKGRLYYPVSIIIGLLCVVLFFS